MNPCTIDETQLDDPCGDAMTMLQSWLVDNYPGQYDVSTALSVARAMIAVAGKGLPP